MVLLSYARASATGVIMDKKVRHPGVRDGYDEWSETYDATPNPLVALDRRYTLRLLRPRPASASSTPAAARATTWDGC